MSLLRVNSFAISLDGYGAGPNQTLEEPLGRNGESLHEWLFPTRTFQALYGDQEGSAGTDEDFAARGFENIGAWILGRNMFGPVRGPWPDDRWRGWWGDNPPYHVPTFVLTHYEREPLVMEGGTTFYFVTDGIERALERARQAADGKDIRLGGGANVIRQYLQAGLIDQMHFAVSPVLLGSGEPVFAGLDLPALGYTCTEHAAGEGAAHYVLSRASA